MVTLSEKRQAHGAEWRQLSAGGQTVKAIATRFGVSRETVSKEIAAAGMAIGRRPRSEAEHVKRFWGRVQQVPGPCWLWEGRIDRQGYGRAYCWTAKRQQLAHRVAYKVAVGPIPPGLTIDHLCRTPRCVRPDHLRACTMTENLMAAHSQAPPAVNARKTHCLRGHSYAPDNCFVDRKGYRHCLKCRALVRGQKESRVMA